MKSLFYPKTIAVIGASQHTHKVGNVIFRNLLKDFRVIPINPNTKEILGKKTFPSVKKVKEKIDLAVITTKAQLVPKIMEECGRKKIKNIIIISSGFKETGNIKLETKVKTILNKYKITCIGVNCLGILNTENNLDTLFLPQNKLKRPKKGNISFICQSGAIGAAILDLYSEQDYGFAKFISYGNATNTDESDLLNYLNKDKKTKVICMYIEAVQNGKKFIKTINKIKKPIIILKGGKTKKGIEAALSHTGSLAGNSKIYSAVFKQNRIIEANSIEELFDIAKIFSKLKKPKGKKILVITNGGGYSIITSDEIDKSKLELAELSPQTRMALKKTMPKTVNIRNPLDLVGDATTKRYEKAIKLANKDKNINILLIIILYQTSTLTQDITDIIIKNNKKPTIVIATGGNKTEIIKRKLERHNIPCYGFPKNAVTSLSKFL